MEASEVKIVVAGKDGQALVGKHFHSLEDKTQMAFFTDNIESFLRYLKNIYDRHDYEGKEGGIFLAYDEKKIQAFGDKPNYNSGIIAECVVEENPLLNFLREMQRPTDVELFEKGLYVLRPFYNTAGKELHDEVKNLSIKKITKIERKMDNAGNFIFAISRTGDRNDIEPTKTVTFSLPIIDQIGQSVDFPFDVIMSYKESEGGVEIKYCLSNPLFDINLKKEKRRLILENIQESGYSVVVGTPIVDKKHDGWKYQANGL